jgi:NTE family protein
MLHCCLFSVDTSYKKYNTQAIDISRVSIILHSALYPPVWKARGLTAHVLTSASPGFVSSAGSVDGAHLSSWFDLESLFTTHPTPVEQTKERKVEFDPAQLMEASRQAVAGAGLDPKAIRAHIGADALAVPSTPEAERRAIIETWLPVHTWPGQRLLIVAVDTEIGEEYVMDRTSGVPLVDAVSASCAIPEI